MTPNEKAKNIIHSASGAADAVALSPIPFADAVNIPNSSMITSSFSVIKEVMEGAVRGAVWAMLRHRFGVALCGKRVGYQVLGRLPAQQSRCRQRSV